MQRVIVIGCPGAGKSHFSRWLRDKTKLPLYYLDQIWHRPDKTTIGREAFDQRLRVLLEKDRWIIDGNYIRTLELRLQACDTVFLLDLPAAFCLQSAEARIGQRREDLPWTEEAGEALDEAFREFILNFPRDTLPKIYRLLEQYQDGREITVFKSREAVNEYIRSHSV